MTRHKVKRALYLTLQVLPQLMALIQWGLSHEDHTNHFSFSAHRMPSINFMLLEDVKLLNLRCTNISLRALPEN